RVDIDSVARELTARIGFRPRAGIVLGSGLGRISERLDRSVSVPFEELPGLPPATVPGHAGRFEAGYLAGGSVLLQAGRYHAYEGHGMDVVAAPVRIAAAIGVEMLVLTNAAGGVRPDLEPADLVLVDDHVNLMFRNPLVGPVLDGERRFPDMSEPYDAVLRSLALAAASDVGVTLKRGVYGAVLGPSFETAAEVRALARLGIDVVGMSTVPEVIAARARGGRCLAVSMGTK